MDIQFHCMELLHSAAARRVWDAPVRVVHWLLVGCFAACWLTQGARRIDLHAAAGYSLCALLLFRVAWGFFGSEPARFSQFVTAPAAAWNYLHLTWRGTAPAYLSHNPAGAWSVLAFIALGLAQCASGVLLLSAQFGYGLLADRISATLASPLHDLHEILAWALVGLLGLHLAGVVVGSASHGENLVGAMISGRKRHVPASAPRVRQHGGVALAIVVGLCVATVVYLRETGWIEGYASLRGAHRASVAKAAGGAWREECGTCHLAYPSDLLPARSWQALLRTPDQHFGEDLALGAAALQALRNEGAAADAGRKWAGWMLRRSVPAGSSPQRITETPFWRQRHEDLADSDFRPPSAAGRHDCEACHDDAASGIFAPRLIRHEE